MKSPIKWPRRSKRLAGMKVWAIYDEDGKLTETGEEEFGGALLTSRLEYSIPFSEFRKIYGDV